MVCPSCSTFTGLAYFITVLVTAMLSAVIFVLVQSAVCRCRRAFKFGSEAFSGIREAEVRAPFSPTNDPNYSEVGGKSAFQVKKNEAYAIPQTK